MQRSQKAGGLDDEAVDRPRYRERALSTYVDSRLAGIRSAWDTRQHGTERWLEGGLKRARSKDGTVHRLDLACGPVSSLAPSASGWYLTLRESGARMNTA